MWKKQNYQMKERCFVFVQLRNYWEDVCHHPALLWAAASSGQGSVQLTFQLGLHYPSKMGTAGLVLLIIKYFLKNFQAVYKVSRRFLCSMRTICQYTRICVGAISPHHK